MFAKLTLTMQIFRRHFGSSFEALQAFALSDHVRRAADEEA
jgi:hypothetical protein